MIIKYFHTIYNLKKNDIKKNQFLKIRFSLLLSNLNFFKVLNFKI